MLKFEGLSNNSYSWSLPKQKQRQFYRLFQFSKKITSIQTALDFKIQQFKLSLLSLFAEHQLEL